MTIFQLILSNRRRNYALRVKMACNEEYMANIGRMFDVGSMRG